MLLVRTSLEIYLFSRFLPIPDLLLSEYISFIIEGPQVERHLKGSGNLFSRLSTTSPSYFLISSKTDKCSQKYVCCGVLTMSVSYDVLWRRRYMRVHLKFLSFSFFLWCGLTAESDSRLSVWSSGLSSSSPRVATSAATASVCPPC